MDSPSPAQIARLSAYNTDPHAGDANNSADQIFYDNSRNFFPLTATEVYSKHIQLPSQEEHIIYDEFLIPRKTPLKSSETENPHSLCMNDDLQRFKETMDLLLANSKSEGFATEELGEVSD